MLEIALCYRTISNYGEKDFTWDQFVEFATFIAIKAMLSNAREI